MKNLFKYIIVVFLFFSITFAIERSKKANSRSTRDVLVNLQEIILEDGGETSVNRKRAHKRKRKVRPKRNGF